MSALWTRPAQGHGLSVHTHKPPSGEVPFLLTLMSHSDAAGDNLQTVEFNKQLAFF